MSGYAIGFAVAVGGLALSRLILFAVALLAHRRWGVPVRDVERLIHACFNHRRCRTERDPHGDPGPDGR